MITHVLPINDLKPHEGESTVCECEPRVEFVDGGILVIHNAYDNREILEKVNDLLNPGDNQQKEPTWHCYFQQEQENS